MRFIRSFLSVTALAVLAACGTPTPENLDPAGAARLETLKHAPDAAGTSIYQGKVYPQQPVNSPQLFSYERRINTVPEGLTASHITRDARGDVVVVESARFTPAYEVLHFEAINQQAGYRGSVVVSGGRHLEFVLNEGGQVTRATEDVAEPVVTGPSLHGFILQHWDTLASGRRLPVRMIVMAKKQTYGFEIRRGEIAAGRASFFITPTNALIRLAVAPLRVDFDAATRRVLRYEGRVPPLQRVDGKLRALDARVEYTMNAPVYR